jgi:CBS-domain-containing membrane protein
VSRYSKVAVSRARVLLFASSGAVIGTVLAFVGAFAATSVHPPSWAVEVLFAGLGGVAGGVASMIYTLWRVMTGGE